MIYKILILNDLLPKPEICVLVKFRAQKLWGLQLLLA